jgi:hypothetical protein
VLNDTLKGTLNGTQLNQLSLAGQPFANWLGMNMTVIMRMSLARPLALILQAQVMLVKVKHPNQEEHQQQACQTAAHRNSLLNQRDGVGQ